VCVLGFAPGVAVLYGSRLLSPSCVSEGGVRVCVCVFLWFSCVLLPGALGFRGHRHLVAGSDLVAAVCG
jgi:hypothetical protein